MTTVSANSRHLTSLAAIAFVGVAIWCIPCPEALTPKAWHLFGIFITTIFAIILNPLPIGAVAFISLCASNVTGILTVKEAFGAFGESMAWLVVLAFFISRGVIKTGLGRRVAYYFIARVGHTTLGLSYALIFTEFILSPIIPSATARGGGIIFPIAKALSEEYGKATHTGSLKNTAGGFLVQVCFQANVITSAMFLTAMVANPMIQRLAQQLDITITWGSWAIGAIVPGTLNLILLPLVIRYIHPPAVKVMKDAPVLAKNALKEMGAISLHEVIMTVVFVCMLVCWMLNDRIGLDPITTALMGFTVLLLTGVLTWNDVLHEKSAWDTLAWYATLVMMSGYLTKVGVMTWVGAMMQGYVSADFVVFSSVSLFIVYFYIHYMFASVTAHAAVLYVTFLVLLSSLGIPTLGVAMLLAYFSTLSGGLTHFGISSAPVFFESGYLSIKEWWKVGAVVGILNFLTWSIIGGIWWRFLGWW